MGCNSWLEMTSRIDMRSSMGRGWWVGSCWTCKQVVLKKQKEWRRLEKNVTRHDVIDGGFLLLTTRGVRFWFLDAMLDAMYAGSLLRSLQIWCLQSPLSVLIHNASSIVIQVSVFPQSLSE